MDTVHMCYTYTTSHINELSISCKLLWDSLSMGNLSPRCHVGIPKTVKYFLNRQVDRIFKLLLSNEFIYYILCLSFNKFPTHIVQVKL